MCCVVRRLPDSTTTNESVPIDTTDEDFSAITRVGICFGHAASHCDRFVQVPKPSASICFAMFRARSYRSG